MIDLMLGFLKRKLVLMASLDLRDYILGRVSKELVS